MGAKGGVAIAEALKLNQTVAEIKFVQNFIFLLGLETGRYVPMRGISEKQKICGKVCMVLVVFLFVLQLIFSVNRVQRRPGTCV